MLLRGAKWRRVHKGERTSSQRLFRMRGRWCALHSSSKALSEHGGGGGTCRQQYSAAEIVRSTKRETSSAGKFLMRVA